MPRADLSELERLEREATAGPWTAEEEDVGDEQFVYCKTTISSPSGAVVDHGGMMPDRPMPLDECDANADLIVALRNSARYLLACARVAEAAKEYRWEENKERGPGTLLNAKEALDSALSALRAEEVRDA